MKIIRLVVCLSLSLTFIAYSQGYKTSTAVFRNISFKPIVDSVSDNILEAHAMRASYGEKAHNPTIQYLTWSPDMHFIAVVVSDI